MGFIQLSQLLSLSLIYGALVQVDCACDQALGLSSTTLAKDQIPNERISASSSENPYTKPALGRLHQKRINRGFGAWCAADDDLEPWFQVDFLQMTGVKKVAIGTNDFNDAYVKTFVLKYSYDKKTWYNVSDGDWNKPRVFRGMRNLYDISTVDIGVAIVTRYIRIYPLTKFYKFCMQAEFYGCYSGKDCDMPIGLTDRSKIKDSRFTASSTYVGHKPSDARLNNNLIRPPLTWGAWCADEYDQFSWIQIDFGYVREISKIETQGHPSSSMEAWVTEYKMNYSVNGWDWTQYEKTFIGNINGKTSRANILEKRIKARYIRILPTKFKEMPCLRIEFYECISRPEFIPKLLKPLIDTTINRGEKFTLKCDFKGQPGIQSAWHLNGDFLPTDDRINTKVPAVANQTQATMLQFKRVKSVENSSTFTCLAWYPSLQNVYSSSTAALQVNEPIPSVNVLNVSVSSAKFLITFDGPLTSDVEGYMLRIQSEKEDRIPEPVAFENTTYHNQTQLHPYRNYTVKVAMLYIQKEVGKYYSEKKFETKQDRPYGAPQNFNVAKATHNSLYCSWELPVDDLRNGPITHYEIRYMKSAKKNKAKSSVVNYALVNGTRVILRQLDAGSNYEVSVRAFTKVGGGPFVHPPTLIFTGKATEELNAINELVITEGNAAAVGVRLSNITADPNFLNKHDVELTIDILEKVVEAQNSSELLGQSLVNAVSNVLKANKTVLHESEITNRTGTRYVKMLEKWLENVKPSDKELRENSENVVVKKIFLAKYKIKEGIKFAEADGNEIIIPKEALPKNESEESIYFVYYKTNKFFTEKRKLEEECIDGFTRIRERVYTPVISGEIVGQKTRNLSAPVELRFKAKEGMDLRESACVYWDFQANNAKGAWSTKGCKVSKIVNRTIICHCNHLTNFAAMMDVYAHTSKVCGYHQTVLTYISVIGCFLSLIGLFLTFLTYLLFRRLLREMAAKVLIQLCAALFIVIVTFVTGIEQTDKPYVCTAVAVVLHYFTLVSFMWMLMEAGFMYHAFVRVWPPREGGDIVRSTIVAWGVPFFIVLIAFLTNMDSYGGTHYCHVTGIPLYAGYLAPIGLIIFINFVIFVFIMYRLSTRPNSSTDQSSVGIAFVRLRRAFGIMILMGLSWAFGFGSASKARLEFSYLFAVCNGLQGFAIFLFYCLAQKNARNAWYRFFTCDTRSEQKITTDSFYERRRMSSNASNRTNTLQFNRMGSNASSVFLAGPIKTYSNGNMRQPPDILMTIDEADAHADAHSPILSHEDAILPLTDTKTGNHAAKFFLDSSDEEDSYAEDEALNRKIERQESNRKSTGDFKEYNKEKLEVKESIGDFRESKADFKEYSSYRALSCALSSDVINAACSNNIRKSMEHLHKKAPNENRQSMVETASISLSPRRQKVRNAKSCDNLSKKGESVTGQRQDIPLVDFSNVDLKGYRHINSTENFENKSFGNTLSSTDETVVDKKGHCFKPKTSAKPDSNTGTLKSDAATMTDNDKSLRPPLYKFRGPDDLGRSENDIMEWLHGCKENEKKDSDSDYSSSYYRTSRSSSMTDLSSPSRRISSSSESRKKKDKHLLNEMVMGPLRGKSNNNNNNIKKLNRKSDISMNSENTTDVSEDGYSASEEDVIDLYGIEKQKPKRRRQRQRSTSSLLKTNQNQYIKLEEPTAHVSYV